MSEGFHRIHLRAVDGDNITLYLPLKEDGQLNVQGHRPWLIKALWDGFDVLGELELGDEGLNLLRWGDDDVFATDLGTAPIRMGTVVTVYDSDDPELADAFELTIADVRRV